MKRFIQLLSKFGKPVGAWVGVYVAPLTQEIARSMGIGAKNNSSKSSTRITSTRARNTEQRHNNKSRRKRDIKTTRPEKSNRGQHRQGRDRARDNKMGKDS